jgi:hypothetical protein
MNKKCVYKDVTCDYSKESGIFWLVIAKPIK